MKKSTFFKTILIVLVLIFLGFGGYQVIKTDGGKYPFCFNLPPYGTAQADWTTYRYSKFRDECLIRVGAVFKDPLVCTFTRGLNFYDCFGRLGKISKDPNMCNKFQTDPSMRDACFSQMVLYNSTGDPCKKLSNSESGTCYRSLAVGKKDESYCLKIDMNFGGGNPKFNCLVDLAIIKKNSELCDLLDVFMPENMNSATCKSAAANVDRQKEVKQAL